MFFFSPLAVEIKITNIKPTQAARQFEKVAGVSWLHYVALLLNLNTILCNFVHLTPLKIRLKPVNYPRGSKFCLLAHLFSLAPSSLPRLRLPGGDGG